MCSRISLWPADDRMYQVRRSPRVMRYYDWYDGKKHLWLRVANTLIDTSGERTAWCWHVDPPSKLRGTHST
jgi:hypothetical protein